MERKATRSRAILCVLLAASLGACAGDPATTQSTLPAQNLPQAAAPDAPAKSAPRAQPVKTTSRHPLMQPQAIAAAAANFNQCIARLGAQAQARGISRAVYDRETRGLEPDLKILELMNRQPEFTRSVWDYVDMLVAERRIAKGREMVQVHRATFERLEQTYGIDPYVVAAIWGIESNFGASAGDRDVIRSTATLACIGRRQDYFRDEFLAAVEIVARGDIQRARFKGSWAGAFGQTQFMPTTFKRLAVDFSGDGRRDLVDTVADALASTANNLRRNGWQQGVSWGYEVTLPASFDYGLADKKIRKSAAAWQALGVRRVRGQTLPAQADGYLYAPAGARGPAFLMTRNFQVILRYNPADAYALAIGHLADRIRGGGPFEKDWPRNEQVLSRN
jgi:membrane-bound lytic murein transglycosylase B